MNTIEVKIPKEVRQHKESIFFGLSVRQFICSAFAVVIAAAVFLLLGNTVGKEIAGWGCILAAAPFAIAGYFSYNGMTLEQFVWVFLKSEILCAGSRPFIAENFHVKAMSHKRYMDDD